MAALCRGIPGKLYSPLQKQHSHIDATFLFSNSPLCIGKPFIVRVDLGVIQVSLTHAEYIRTFNRSIVDTYTTAKSTAVCNLIIVLVTLTN